MAHTLPDLRRTATALNHWGLVFHWISQSYLVKSTLLTKIVWRVTKLSYNLVSTSKISTLFTEYCQVCYYVLQITDTRVMASEENP